MKLSWSWLTQAESLGLNAGEEEGVGGKLVHLNHFELIFKKIDITLVNNIM